MNTGKHFTVFEHQFIKLDQEIDGLTFDKQMLGAMQNYFGEKGVPYFSLGNNGVRFNEYVGVLQIGNITIEVLPKADKTSVQDTKENWRKILIGMLKAIGTFEVKSTGDSKLKIQPNSILHLYFELFIKEVEYLLHAGLVKKYRMKEGNVTALKGNLLFSKHIQQNLIHQERFYVSHTTYDTDHTLHYILYKTIKLLKQINTYSALHSRIGSLLLYFPEMQDIRVTEATFEKISYNHKTQSYKRAIEIAKLLLLNYHPDVIKGKNNVLALMFDMNVLWEKFVAVSLRKQFNVHEQPRKYFWKPENGIRSFIQPDIVINHDKAGCVVVDTKWKNINGSNPSADDLRQMYVYHDYYGADRVALMYPGQESTQKKGNFIHPQTSNDVREKECGLIFINVEPVIRDWQTSICKIIDDWIDQTNQQTQLAANTPKLS